MGPRIHPRLMGRALWRLGNLTKGFDIVHLHAARAGALGRVAFRGPASRVIYNPHGGAFHPRAGLVGLTVRAVERSLAGRTAAVVVASSYERELVESVLGRGRARIRLIPHGMDLVTNSPLPHPSLPIRRFGMVGRLIPEKRHALALNALARLLQSIPDAHLVIVGQGETKQDLLRLARQLGVVKNVTFSGYVLAPREAYASFDALLLVSESESSSLVVAEALASGRPAVITATGGMKDLVRDSYNGLVVDGARAEGVAEAMRRIAVDVALAESLVRNARLSASAIQSWECVADHYRSLYLETIRG
jgi:glycosyltransferase involved in cell wall biosynthesis